MELCSLRSGLSSAHFAAPGFLLLLFSVVLVLKVLRVASKRSVLHKIALL